MKDHEGGSFSYSFDGADLICASILRNIVGGTYIDVGANHPINLNNTYYFYRLGWRGLAIDGNDKFTFLWNDCRSEDIFINTIVSDRPKTVQFNKYSDDTMSTIDPISATRYSQRFADQDVSKEIRNAETLFDLKQKYLQDREVHLLSVDVEGEDLNCLMGARLDIWKPGLILVETKGMSPYNVMDNEIVKFLAGLGYRMIAKTPLDAVFVYPSKSYLQWVPDSIVKIE